MPTITFDTYKAMKEFQSAGASEDLATAIVRVIAESASKDVMPRNETLDRTEIRLALSTVELRITKRFAWLSLGVFGGSIFCSLVLSISLLAS